MFIRIFAVAALATGILATPMDLANRQTVEPINIQGILDAHNVHRANHSANPLTWNAEIASDAQTLAQRCVFQHDTSIGGGGYGQNIAGGYATIIDAVHNGWYNPEEPRYAPYYGQPNPPASVFDSVGHFTQVVWKATTQVGCARVNCPNSVGQFTVCNYKPPGNFGGEYGTNVGRPLGHPTVT